MRTSNHEFIRRQFFLPRDQASYVRESGFAKNISQARIVRDAIRDWAKSNTNTKLSPEPKSMLRDRKVRHHAAVRINQRGCRGAKIFFSTSNSVNAAIASISRPRERVRAILPFKDILAPDAFNVVVLDLSERLAAFCLVKPVV